MTDQDVPPRSAADESKQYLVIGGLLVLIIALLATLWVRERRSRVSAEATVVQLRQQLQAIQQLSGLRTLGQGDEALQEALRQRMEGGELEPLAPGTEPPALPAPVQREDLPSETAEFQGRVRTVFRISEAAGRRIGFAPGDVVVVQESPATAPGEP